MLVVMSATATDRQIRGVIELIERNRLQAHLLPGPTRTAIGITGHTADFDGRLVEMLPGVEQLIRISKPYKLASREMHPDDTVISLPQATFGPQTFTIVAGPCAVESEEQIVQTADFLLSQGVRLMRAGAYKPRTSPYSFQGLGQRGLDILTKVRHRTGIGIVTEVLDVEDVTAVEAAADIIQIGTRNMQNFSLLKRLSRATKPVLLKRGMAATLEEWLMAAEYVMAGGNRRVILCERGVRTFADHSRNTLDLAVIPPAKKLCHLPIVVDPSHGTGNREFVPPMALAALAAGADGLLVEVHAHPADALSDGMQSLDFEQFKAMLERIKLMAGVVGRKVS
jgi:3-deoxy-7-phosphoheptulonate synthase